MARFIEIQQSAKVREIINCDLIRRIWNRSGYEKPMVTIEVDFGTRGHWEANGANSVFRELHCYGSYDDFVRLLTVEPSPSSSLPGAR